MFELDPISGVLTIVAPLDYEQQNSYALTVRAMDSAGINSLTSIAEVILYSSVLVH